MNNRIKSKSSLTLLSNDYQGSYINDYFIGDYNHKIEKQKQYLKVIGLDALRYESQYFNSQR